MIEHSFKEGRRGFLQIVRGSILAGDQALAAGDGAIIEAENNLNITASEDAEMLLFDMC